MNAKEKAQELLAPAGIVINGPGSTDPQVKDERVFDRIFSSGSMGAGESYMDGWWEVEDLSGFFTKLFQAEIHAKLQNIGTLWYVARSYLLNLQNKDRAFIVGEQHYDTGNDLYAAMLDKRMVYTCGYWSGTPKATTLEEAQEAKLDLICKKIGLQKGHKVLDVGCGWGSFAKFAAEKYGAEVVGITVSKEQAELARKLCEGLPVEIRLEDYRETKGTFDRIVSVGMFEHVGPKNYRTFFKKMKSLLTDDGLFLLHTIGSSVTVWHNDAWVDKYIFPGGVLPSVGQIGNAIDRQFIVEDWHNFGVDYDTTLMAWHENFERAWPTLKTKYSERFRRMWRYYLMSSAGMFRSRGTHLWQIVLSKRGVPGGYKSIR